jgi:hypothetical protein
MMRRTLLLGVVFGLAVFGCASSFPREPFNRASNPPVRRIALLQVRAPLELDVAPSGGAGMAFGLIGAAVEESDHASKANDFNARVSSQRSTLGRELADALLAELKKAGYSVVFLEHERPIEQTGEDDSRDYSKIATDADAILDVSFAKAGYVEDSSDYVPWILVRVSLISAKTRSRLYSQELSYGTDLLKNGIPHFPSSGTYIYDDFDSLMERAGEAAEGLKVGLPPIAARIGADLR